MRLQSRFQRACGSTRVVMLAGCLEALDSKYANVKCASKDSGTIRKPLAACVLRQHCFLTSAASSLPLSESGCALHKPTNAKQFQYRLRKSPACHDMQQPCSVVNLGTKASRKSFAGIGSCNTRFKNSHSRTMKPVQRPSEISLWRCSS